MGPTIAAVRRSLMTSLATGRMASAEDVTETRVYSGGSGRREVREVRVGLRRGRTGGRGWRRGLMWVLSC